MSFCYTNPHMPPARRMGRSQKIPPDLILLANSFSAGGARDIAGGGAKRNHREPHNTARALKGRRTWVISVANSGPASLPGREKSFLVFSGAYARAPAPANIHRPSGAGNSFAEFANSIRFKGERRQ